MSDGGRFDSGITSAGRSTVVNIGDERTAEIMNSESAGNSSGRRQGPPARGGLSIDLDESNRGRQTAASGRRALSIDIDSAEKPSAAGGGRGGGDDCADDAAFGAPMPKTPSERVRAIIMQAASERQDAVKAESIGKQRAAELHAKRQRSRRGLGSNRRAGNNSSNNSVPESDRDAASSDTLSRVDNAARTGTAGGGGGGGGGGEDYDSLVDSGYGEFVADRDDYSDYQESESGSKNDEIHGGCHGGFHGVSISPIRAGPMGPRLGGTSPGSPANSESHLFRRGPKTYSETGTPRSDDGRSAAGGDVEDDNFGETGEGGIGEFYGQRKVGNGYIQMNATGTVASGFTLLDMGGKREQYGGYRRYWQRSETQKTIFILLLFLLSFLLTIFLTLLFTFMFVPRQQQQQQQQQHPPSETPQPSLQSLPVENTPLQSPLLQSQSADSGAQSGESSSLPSSPVEEGSENSSLPASPPSSPSPASEAPSEWPALDVSQPPDVMVGSLQVKYWATWLDDRYETSRPDMPGYLWAKLQFQLHFPSLKTFLSATQNLSIDLLYLNTSLAPPDKATSYPKPSPALLPWPVLDYSALNSTEADSQIVRAVWECNNCRIPGGHGADMEEDEKDGEVLVVMRVRVDGKHLRAVGSSHVIGLNRTVTLNEIGGSRAAIHPRQGMDFVFAVVPHK
ncbi:unnamed protein product [Closterium sp. NIES-54]